MKLFLGLDFGGTKLAAGLVDGEKGVILKDIHCNTPPEKTAAASYAAMMDLAKKLLSSGQNVKRIGVCFDGPIAEDSRHARFSMHVSGWEGVDLAGKIEKELHIPTLIGHDADAAALAEYRFGAGKGVKHMLYFTVSTGIGGGVIIDGKLHRGERAWAGEMGHMVVKPDGPLCPCGRRGCLEATSSGLSIARDMKERLKHATPKPLPAGYKVSILQSIPKDDITAKTVSDAAEKGDYLAKAVWDEAMKWLGLGIASAANILNPGKIVLGGGLTKSGTLLFEPVRKVVSQRVLDPKLEVVPAAFGENVGIMGAASLLL